MIQALNTNSSVKGAWKRWINKHFSDENLYAEERATCNNKVSLSYQGCKNLDNICVEIEIRLKWKCMLVATLHKRPKEQDD